MPPHKEILHSSVPLRLKSLEEIEREGTPGLVGAFQEEGLEAIGFGH
jgi:hypothetical protein